MTTLSLALIINTYEQPDYLERVLRAVDRQYLLPNEVVLADDGSGEPTRLLYAGWGAAKSFRCQHVWQEHGGFRRARILNEAIAWTKADLIVFLDGDTVPHPAFLKDHQHVARDGYFTQGHRCLIEKRGALQFGKGHFEVDRRRALFSLQVRGLANAFRLPWPIRRQRGDLRGIRGCNLGIWREDLVAVNEYNEAFEGWGREDSELAVRLMNNGIQRQDVRGQCLCYHLWHPPADRSALAGNNHLLEEAIQSGDVRCERGLARHTATR